MQLYGKWVRISRHNKTESDKMLFRMDGFYKNRKVNKNHVLVMDRARPQKQKNS